MTLAAFEKKVMDDDFIKKYRESVLQLMKHKQDLYQNTDLLPTTIDQSPYTDIIKKLTHLKREMLPPDEAHSAIRANLLSAVNDRKLGMKSLIGRAAQMDHVAALLFAFSRNYRVFTNVFLNFAIMGSAGVGKTAIAKVLGFVFKKSYILLGGSVVMCTRQEMVAEFVGATAIKTRKILFAALEGVLFIDEAYALTPCKESESKHGFENESVTEMINFMDKTVGLMVIMVAGYEEVMKRCFFTYNEGMNRRFPNMMVLGPYSSEDLTRILINNLTEAGIHIETTSKNYLYSIVSYINDRNPVLFRNQAGDMLNLSQAIVQNIYTSTSAQWNVKSDDKENRVIIQWSLEDFLDAKGYDITW